MSELERGMGVSADTLREEGRFLIPGDLSSKYASPEARANLATEGFRIVEEIGDDISPASIGRICLLMSEVRAAVILAYEDPDHVKSKLNDLRWKIENMWAYDYVNLNSLIREIIHETKIVDDYQEKIKQKLALKQEKRKTYDEGEFIDPAGSGYRLTPREAVGYFRAMLAEHEEILNGYKNECQVVANRIGQREKK